MDGDYVDPGTDNTRGPSESPSVDEHQNLAHANRNKALISRDIDALVQLKLLRKAL